MSYSRVEAVMRGVNVEPYLAELEENGPRGRKERRVPAESIELLKKAGFIRSLVPAKLGGLELTPQEFFSIQMRIAEGDMSTAWVGGIIAVHAFQIALMDGRAQKAVYGANPDTCVSSSYNPVGARVERVGGGVMLSGRWGWSSGSDHCTWCLLGGIVPGEGYRTFLVSRADYEIEDTWFSMGLEGTGSNDIVMEKPVFVPDHMSHMQIDGFHCRHDQSGAIYSIPWAQWFIRVVTTPAIGAVKRAIRIFAASRANASTDPAKDAADPDILRRLAEASQLVDEAEALLFDGFDAMLEAARSGRDIPLLDRVRYRYRAGVVIANMMKAIDLLFDVAGGRSVFVGAELQQIWHDIHIARAHVANNPVGFGRNYGNMILGGENKDVFV